MNETTTEQQLNTLQSWWQRYGVALIVSAVLAVGGFVGWDQWQLFQTRQVLKASDIYQRLLLLEQEARAAAARAQAQAAEEGAQEEGEEEEEGEETGGEEEGGEEEGGEEEGGEEEGGEEAETADVNEEEDPAALARQRRQQVLENVERLRREFPQTSYAHYALLFKVRYMMEEGRLAEAEETLEWVRMHSTDPELTALATLRLGYVLHARNEREKALELLRTASTHSFTPMFRELIGDILWEQGDPVQAWQEYQVARRLYREGAREIPPSLIMKLQEVAGITAPE